MMHTTHNARIVGPIPYVAPGGRTQNIPVGPVLLEATDGAVVDIVWGFNGQNSAALPLSAIEAAQAEGSLVLLD